MTDAKNIEEQKNFLKGQIDRFENVDKLPFLIDLVFALDKDRIDKKIKKMLVDQ